MRLKARIRLAAQPFSAMMAATVPTEISTPVAASLVWTMRWPKIPSEESNIALTSPVSSRCRAAVGDSSWSSQRYYEARGMPSRAHIHVTGNSAFFS